MMRSRKFLFMAAAIASAVSVFSCAKVEDSTTVVKVEPITFGASFYNEDDSQEHQNKTVLDQTGYKILWENSDQIAVSGGTDPFVITPEIEEPSASVNFRGEAAVADKYYAAYPYSALRSWNGSTATMALPQIQSARLGSFASDLNISVSSTTAEDRNFQFHHVLGYLKFTIGEQTGEITEFVVSTIGKEKLTGRFTVDCSTEIPVLVADANANTSAAISSETPLKPGDYYLAMFPGTYEQGLRFIVKGPKGVATKTLSKKLVLERGKVNTLGTINVTNWVKSVEKSTELSAMSFNVRNKEVFEKPTEAGGQDYEKEFTHWDNRKNAIAAMIADVQPDLIGLQEPSKSQLNELQTLLAGYTWEGYLPSGWKAEAAEVIKVALLNGIFYRTEAFDMISSGQWYFGSSDGSYDGQSISGVLYRRFYQWAELTHKKSGKKVWLFNTHFPTNSEDSDGAHRIECMNKLVNKVKELTAEDDVVYVTGDFNCAYSNDLGKSILSVAQDYLFDARTETEDKDNWKSINSWNPPTLKGIESIDHVFYRNVKPLQYRTIVTGKYGVEYLSDHFPINFKSKMTWEVPVGPVFDAEFAEGFDITKFEAIFEGFLNEDNFGDGEDMEGFGPEDSFEFN